MCAVQLLRVSVHERISAAAEDFLLQVEKREKTVEIPLRALLTERLTAAAEEIVGLLEETVAEYEDRVERSEREICRQRRLLDAVLKPEVKLLRADVQQLLESKEEVPPEQQERSSSLDQEEPEPSHIKEEQEELWTSQEGEQLQGLEEADITTFTFTPVPVKSEDDEEEPQSSQLHHRQTEQMETEGDGGSKPARNSHPHRHLQTVIDYKASEMSVAEIEVSCDDWEEIREPQSGLNSLEVPVIPMTCNSADKPFSCSECGKRFAKNGFLETHMRIHTGDKPFICSVCGKKYTKNGYLIQHMAVHRGEKRHSCGLCKKRFVWHSGVECHTCIGAPVSSIRYNSDGKSLNFSECCKRRCYSYHLKTDTGTHTEENLFSCSVCARKFTQRGYLIQHMARHTGKIRFRCCVCDKKFAYRHELKNHRCVGESEPPASSSNEQMKTEVGGLSKPARTSHSDRHLQPGTDNKTSDSSETEVRDEDWKETSEPQSGLNSLTNNKVPLSRMECSTEKKSFICSECGKTFFGEENLKMHMKNHAGEKPFSCSLCDKGFTQKGYLTNHMSVHTEEKRFIYCVCGKRFAWRYNLKKHKCAGESSQFHSSQTLKKREAEPLASSSKTSDCSQLYIEVNDLKKTKKPQSDSPQDNDVLESESTCDAEERPFSCSECGKRFRRKKNLQEHMRIHTGEKPFGCSVCMKYFSCSGSLRKHMRIHTGEKPFVCSVCGNRFTESGHLKVHMRTHTGEKPFSCSVCGKNFTWKQSFNNHVKYHTEETREIN